MFEAHHVIVRAHGSTKFVHDDRDSYELLVRVVRAYGRSLLAFCLMPNRVHAVVEGAGPAACDRLGVVMRAYARVFNARHAGEGRLVRGDLRALPVLDARGLAHVIAYVHQNPVECIVPQQVSFEWSSARAFVGLVRSPPVNIERALALVGESRRGLKLETVSISGLEPSLTPSASPSILVSAAAHAWGVLAEDVVGNGRRPRLVAARATYVHLGRLESYSDPQLAPSLRRARSTLPELAAKAEPVATAIARTYLRVPALAARLKPVAQRPVVPGSTEAPGRPVRTVQRA